MSTYDLTNSSTELPATPNKQAYAVQKEVSFVTDPGGDGDLFTVMALPANCLVAFSVEVETVEGGAATIEMKTTEDTPQTILTGASINSAVTLIGDGADGDAAVVMFYTHAATTVQIETNTALTGAAVLQVRALIVGGNAIDLG